MRIAIVGSRQFANPRKVREYVMDLICNTQEDGEFVIVSGGAAGPDTIAEEVADQFQVPVALYLPAWDVHGKRAGVFRNQEIVDKADRVVAFWDGESKGTLDTIKRTLKARKHLEVIFP